MRSTEVLKHKFIAVIPIIPIHLAGKQRIKNNALRGIVVQTRSNERGRCTSVVHVKNDSFIYAKCIQKTVEIYTEIFNAVTAEAVLTENIKINHANVIVLDATN